MLERLIQQERARVIQARRRRRHPANRHGRAALALAKSHFDNQIGVLESIRPWKRSGLSPARRK
jgi:hypothetical protein